MFFHTLFAISMTLALSFGTVVVMAAPSMVGGGVDVAQSEAPASASSSFPWSSGWWGHHHGHHHRTSSAIVPSSTPSRMRATPNALGVVPSVVAPISVATTSTFSAATPTATLSTNAQAYLDAHNSVRAQHNSTALLWSTTLSNVAQQWADECQFMHSNGAFGPYGENLAAGTLPFAPQTAVELWASEVSEYNPANATASHFTQIVWKNTIEVGCAFAQCSNIFNATVGPAEYHVCEYYSAGNVLGLFSENVQV